MATNVLWLLIPIQVAAGSIGLATGVTSGFGIISLSLEIFF
jgi:hypothetical protein